MTPTEETARGQERFPKVADRCPEVPIGAPLVDGRCGAFGPNGEPDSKDSGRSQFKSASTPSVNIEETARAKCISENGIWGGAWSDAWSPETLDAAHALKTPQGYLAVEGDTRSPSVRFKYFIPFKFIPKGGHDVPIVNTEQYQGAA